MTAGSQDGKLTPDCIAETDQPSIVFANADDWEAIYVNGKLMCQDHVLYTCDVLLALEAAGIKNICSDNVDDDWLAEQGLLPNSIEDVKWDN